MAVRVVTSAKSLARELWAFGEDDLWPQALVLAPGSIAALSAEFGRLRTDPTAVARVWPQAPAEAFLLLPVIEQLEGRRRPARRSRRRPLSAMPDILRSDGDDASRHPGFGEVRSLVEAETARARA
ncbi:MAG TPA: hypothetical protein VHO01_12620 [Jatrophihabitans sp.]|nr:hypothetical protein [Jatrophihabitans sp.]